MNRIRILSIAAATVCGTAIVAQTTNDNDAAPPAVITTATGFDYSRGSYGFPTDTEVLSIPFDLSYEAGPWILRASVPWLTIDGPATVVDGGAGNARPDAGSESGLGDLYAGATYRFGPVFGEVNVDTTVRAKLPTADEARGLGTGETDYYAQVDMYRTIGGITPFASLGYRVLGDNARYQLRDGMYASAGAHVRTSASTVVSTSYDWADRIVDRGDHASSATLAITHDLNPRWRIVGYAMKGFSDASPDVGAGLRLNYRF